MESPPSTVDIDRADLSVADAQRAGERPAVAGLVPDHGAVLLGPEARRHRATGLREQVWSPLGRRHLNARAVGEARDE